MTISYDSETDILYIRLREGTFELVNKSVSDDTVLDIGPENEIVGIEVMNARQMMGESGDLVIRNLPGVRVEQSVR